MSQEKNTIQASGKLLISAEYFVLDGALALALPTQLGQRFSFEKTDSSSTISWRSFDDKKQLWFEGIFETQNFTAQKTSDVEVSNRLTQIFIALQNLQPSFFKTSHGWNITTHLQFPKNWGLGTSSTLIYALAKWAQVDAFVLLEKTFSGSGYDIACAGAKQSITYSKINGVPKWATTDFHPPFSEQLYFVFLGKKQNSREGIAHYRKMEQKENRVSEISELTQKILRSKTLSEFENLINLHEEIISNTLHLQKVKDLYFKDYWGSVKSLGAWGGDFVLVTSDRSEEETKKYFIEKGFEVFLKYEDLIL